MNRSVVILVTAVAAFGVFIGVQAGRTARHRARPASDSAAPQSSATILLQTQEGDLVRVRRSTLPPPPPRNYAAITQAITEGRDPVTYLDEILAVRGGNIARWVDRRDNPITVWIQPTSDVKDFWPAYRTLARDAFYTWSNAGIPIRFLFVDDSAAAEVRLRWMDRFPDTAVGKTYWARDVNWWIVGGDIEIALHSAAGVAFDRQAVHAIVLHEVGHLLGLDHATNTANVMAPRVRVMVLSPADLRTLHLIYKLPPGPTREATQRP